LDRFRFFSADKLLERRWLLCLWWRDLCFFVEDLREWLVSFFAFRVDLDLDLDLDFLYFLTVLSFFGLVSIAGVIFN